MVRILRGARAIALRLIPVSDRTQAVHLDTAVPPTVDCRLSQ